MTPDQGARAKQKLLELEAEAAAAHPTEASPDSPAEAV